MSTSVHDPLLSVDNGMGKDRRRFLIVSVFDVCLITLLWLICTVTQGSDWPTVFFKEINIFEPNFLKISLFDIVIIAVFRMLVLLFCYAILLVGHWLPVALTTGVTTAFLIVKVLFFFSQNQGGLPQFLVVLSSLTVAWFELWLVPFRVLPRERRQMIVPEMVAPAIVVARNPQTDDEFRSAMEYSSGSESEDERACRIIAASGKVYSKKEYSDVADQAEMNAIQYFRQVDTWKLICRDPEVRFLEEKRLHYLRAELPCSPQSLFRAVWKDNQMWNKQITETRVVLHIDAATELVYSVTAPALRGYITSRDFLDVRRIRLDTDNDVYEGFYVSVDSSVLPANSNRKMVRGFNGPNMVRVARSTTDSNMSVYEWLMDSDIKGDVPRRLVERTLASFLVGYVKNLRNFLRDRASEYP